MDRLDGLCRLEADRARTGGLQLQLGLPLPVQRAAHFGRLPRRGRDADRARPFRRRQTGWPAVGRAVRLARRHPRRQWRGAADCRCARQRHTAECAAHHPVRTGGRTWLGHVQRVHEHHHQGARAAVPADRLPGGHQKAQWRPEHPRSDRGSGGADPQSVDRGRTGGDRAHAWRLRVP